MTFRIVFNRSPDFFTADDLGRQADDFQYYVGSDVPVAPWLYDSIVRGGEIHSTGLIHRYFGSRRRSGLSQIGTDLDVLPYLLETYEFGVWTGVHIVDYIVVRR